VSGPAAMSFASPTSLTTQATFPQIGTYVLQLAVSDSQLTGNGRGQGHPDRTLRAGPDGRSKLVAG
jgi:hypothetical protein